MDENEMDTELDTGITESDSVDSDLNEADVPNDDVVTEDYTPNFEYKVRDDAFQFDDRVKTVVKTKEDEEYFRDLYTKSGGVDHYKTKINEYEDNYGKLYGHTEKLTKGFQNLKTLRDDGKLNELFTSLGVTEDQLMKHAIGLAKEQQLPEDERMKNQQMRDYESKINNLEHKLNNVTTQFSSQREQADTMRDVDNLKGFVSSDRGQAIGNVMKANGLNLMQEVVNHGLAVHQTTGNDIPVEQAFNEVLTKYNFMAAPTQQAAPTLPSIRGGGGSPNGLSINSIEDLKKLANQFE